MTIATTITKEDVLFVASMFKKDMSDKQIQFVIDNYEAEAAADPSGCLPLWIENLLDQSNQVLEREIAEKGEMELIQSMLTYLYNFVQKKDLRSSTINHIMDNTHYVEALYLGENECSEHETILEENKGKVISFKEAYETLHSSFVNNVFNN